MYLHHFTDNILNWKLDTEAVYMKVISRLYFMRKKTPLWCRGGYRTNWSIMYNPDHPLRHLLDRQRNTVSNRLAQLRRHNDHHRKSFLPKAMTVQHLRSLSCIVSFSIKLHSVLHGAALAHETLRARLCFKNLGSRNTWICFGNKTTWLRLQEHCLT